MFIATNYSYVREAFQDAEVTTEETCNWWWIFLYIPLGFLSLMFFKTTIALFAAGGMILLLIPLLIVLVFVFILKSFSESLATPTVTTEVVTPVA